MRVVDASAVGAIAFGESEGDEILDAIEGHELQSSALLPFELANVAWKRIRADPSHAEEMAANLADGLAIHVLLQEVDYLEVLALAVTHGVSAYDASYLWVARTRGAPLVTLDRRLRTIASGA